MIVAHIIVWQRAARGVMVWLKWIIWVVLALAMPGGTPPRALAARVRRAKEQRLQELEVQAAAYGLQVPPHIATEIDDLTRELADDQALIEALEGAQFDAPMDEVLRHYDPRDLIRRAFRDQISRGRSLEQTVDELKQQMDDLRADVTTWFQRREEQASKDAERQMRERSVGGILTGVVVALLLIVLVLLIIMLVAGLR